jgi:long-chain acyl-CoA synthetase
MLGPGNSLKIIDRIKNIFKLQQGEYIVSEKLERAYEQSPYV